MDYNRRLFLKNMGQLAATYGVASGLPFVLFGCDSAPKNTDTASSEDSIATASETAAPVAQAMAFKISLAEWSLHKAIRGGQLKNLDFPAKAKNDFDISAVEYVSQLFGDKKAGMPYLTDLKKRAADNGVTNVLIMVDNEGELGDTNDAKRKQAVENHYKWVDAAKFLGCHSIRVNAAGKGTAAEVAKAATDGLGRLTEYGAKNNISVIVENHGGYSSDGAWLANVIKQVNNPQCGTLPDFGNFCLERAKDGCAKEYDKYKGIEEMMPFAKGVSAKSHNFDASGNETDIDFARMMKIVKDAGYSGYVGIEYEGSTLSEEDGIKATKNLLEKTFSSMA